MTLVVDGREWTARRDDEGWSLRPRAAGDARRAGASGGTRVEVSADTLWRVATRGIEPDEARRRATVDGDEELAAAALRLLSIIR